jgi:uncharacterized membrane protein YdbT with pleckstrin-like domain
MANAPTELDDAAPPPTDHEVPEWLSLEADEELQWAGQPVPLSIVGTAVWGLLLTVVLVGILLLLTLPFTWLSIRNTDYVVTDETLYVKKGVLSTNIESVGLDKIQNTEYSQSFWGKQFGYGSIDVSTAGSSGAEIGFQNVANASEVRDLITRLSNEHSAGSRGRGTGEEERTTGVAPATEGMDELVAELRATREAMERVERRLAEASGSTADGASADGTSVDETSVDGDRRE